MATQKPTTTSTPPAITFVVPGQRAASRGAGEPRPADSTIGGRVKDAVVVSTRRSGGDTVRVSAQPGEDVVLLRIAGGPALVLHPETARDLMLGQGTAQRSATPPHGDVPVPAQLRWRGLEQAAPTRSGGFLGDVLLSGFEVITDLFKDKAVDFAKSLVVDKVDGQVDAGVYALNRNTLAPLKGNGQKLAQVPAPAGSASEPLLVLIHGTFVDTFSTFGKLWTLHPQRVRELFDHYGNRVYALDHPTVGASPITNALTLVNALPAGARLHLVTHSRGGLVAEVLARVAGQEKITQKDLEFFKDDAKDPLLTYATQRRELQELAAAMKAKGIQVNRVVRVACPARGTLLASKRLDAYLSVLKWTIELAGVPVVPSLVEFLTEVARRRARPAELPGLASMIPDTPLVNWLNSAEEGIPGELRVVAGDLQGDSIGSWLKTLLADAYYWTDNDIVVQTRSMYGGSPRNGGASFLLDQTGKSTHFNYFANESTAKAVVNALTQNNPEGFSTIGPLSWRGEDSSGQRGARRSADDSTPAHEKPAVFVLPGILGSHLKARDKRIWLSLRLIGGLEKLKYEKDNPGQVQPDGPIGMVYDDLMDHLAQSHDVKHFAFDWRLPIEKEAERLAEAVEKALDERKNNNQPVRILAHSMGGVVTRTMLLQRPKTFKRMMDREGARFVMLGTPNGGSWAPMQVLSGDDTFGNALASFGSPLRNKEARQLMAEMPGFLQLQARLLDPQLALDRQETWVNLAKRDLEAVQQSNWWHRSFGETDGGASDQAYEWGVPPQDVLNQARKLRLALDAQIEAPAGTATRASDPAATQDPNTGALRAYAHKMALVVGKAKLTPVGYEWTDKGLVYLNVTDTAGDGRVPLESAQLPGVRTWTLDCEHGSLPDARGAFDAYVELLTKGDTQLLPRLEAGATRGKGAGAAGATAALVRSRPSRARPAGRPARNEREVLGGGLPEGPSDGVCKPPLRLSVLNGNLSFVNGALMVGHSRALRLTGTEKVVNALIGGTMKASLDAGLYPEAPGTHQLFLNTRADTENPWRSPQPASVVVVGLGDEGKLKEADLTRSVQQAVVAWVQRVAEGSLSAGFAGTDDAEADFRSGASPRGNLHLTATLMGSGGAGISASTAARAIALGVSRANRSLDAVPDADWPKVHRLSLVELYLERASDAWQGLQVLQEAQPNDFEVDDTIESGTGALRRQVDSGYRGTDYDFISATGHDEDTISFRLDTKRARTEINAQKSQGKLLRELVKQASSEANRNAQLGRTLFQLLVPLEVEPFMAGTNRMLLELDEKTAPIPWELLDNGGDERSSRDDDRPWAIRTKLLRKLQQEHYRQQVQDARDDDHVLVVGEPKVDLEKYVRLPGAKLEAETVRDVLTRRAGLGANRVVALIDDNDASSVINALFAKRYRIVHIAGHGEPIERDKAGKVIQWGGVVLSDGVFLSALEIESMRTVPELVFVNCCHLAKHNADDTLSGGNKSRNPFNRAEFAMGVAGKLIAIGVRCVIAAGWAVDDQPAKVFAETFYDKILGHHSFIDAVASAREAAWKADPNSNTWAAYQAYGDPNWVYRRGPNDTESAAGADEEEFKNISSPLGLALALEELATRVQWMHGDKAATLKTVDALRTRFENRWGSMGAIAEALGLAYAQCKDTDSALHWYARAMQANDGSASMKAHEQWGNLKVRAASERLNKKGAGKAETETAIEDLKQGLEFLESLTKLQAPAGGSRDASLIQGTLERHSLCGSAHKRLAQAYQKAADKDNAKRHFEAAHRAYAQAEKCARAQPGSNLHYPLINRMRLQWLLNPQAGEAKTGAISAQDLLAARAALKAEAREKPDFWNVVGQIEVDMLKALQAGDLKAQLASLSKAFEGHHQRSNARWSWSSVADEANLLLSAYADSSDRSKDEKEAAESLKQQLRGYAEG